MASHLNLDERRVIAAMLQRGISIAQIAVQLGRHRSTIHREIRRNFWHDPEVPMASGYWHVNAQQFATARRSRQRKLLRHDALRLAVIDRLKEGWSPEQIAGRLRHEGHRPRSATRRFMAMSIQAMASLRNWAATCRSGGASGKRAMPASPEVLSFQSVA